MIVPSIRALGAILGISHTALNKHLKAGKFKPEPGGGFDPDKVRALLKRNADFEQESQARGFRPGSKAEKPSVRDSEDPAIDPDRASFNKARAYKEKMRAKQAELDLKERMGELVQTSKVKEAIGAMISSTRGAILLLPSKLAPKVAAILDVRECQKLIGQEVDSLLTGLSESRIHLLADKENDDGE